MKNNIQLEEQVLHFIQSLPPEPKKALRRGLKGLENDKGDISRLKDESEGYYRLRVKNYRIVFRRLEPSTIQCVYAEHREEVYVKWAAIVAGK